MAPSLRLLTTVLTLVVCSDRGAADAAAVEALGVGAIGDSYTDEYRFYPPDRSTALSWVEILAEATGLDFGPFEPADLGTPRHRGYARNWARSAATSDDAVAEGQHLGLARQIADGEVGLAFVFIGGNDFLDSLAAPDHAALEHAEDCAAANVRTIVETLLEASPEVRLVLATVPSMTCLPEIRSGLADGSIAPERVDAALAALGRFNRQVRDLARTDPRIALADLEREASIADRLLPAAIRLPGLRVELEAAGNGPGRFFLADGRHLGTFGQGLIAQRMIHAANARFGLRLPSRASSRSSTSPAPRPSRPSRRLPPSDRRSRPVGGYANGFRQRSVVTRSPWRRADGGRM